MITEQALRLEMSLLHIVQDMLEEANRCLIIEGWRVEGGFTQGITIQV